VGKKIRIIEEQGISRTWHRNSMHRTWGESRAARRDVCTDEIRFCLNKSGTF